MATTMPRPFRVPEDLYRRAQERARADDVTLTSVVVAALERYAAHGSLEPVPEQPPARECIECGRPIVAAVTSAGGWSHVGGVPPGPFHVPR